MTAPGESFALRTSGDTEGTVSRVLDKLEIAGNDLPILRLVANLPSIFRPFVLMSDALLHRGSVPPRIREALILHLAARHRLGYEWHEHLPMGLEAGLSQDECDLIADGQHPDDDIALACAYADGLLNGDDVVATREAVESRWGAEEALELAVVVGWWGGLVPCVLRAFSGRGLPGKPWPPASEPTAPGAGSELQT
jgi:4-carboxymuconolactone decarboxylase